jgi:hypothetical protein
MAAGTRRKDLVYASAGDSVLVYDYATEEQVGKLAYFTSAHGSCTDGNGDVFVTNFNAADVLEFAHGGTKPIRTLVDPSAYPVDCSVDPVTGNLAVVNEYGKTEYTQGNVAIYVGGKGKPKLYKYSGFTYFIAGGYDGHGDLVVSGYQSRSVPFAFAYLPLGGHSLAAMSLPVSYNWYGPPYIRWDGQYLVVGFRDEFDGLIFVPYAIQGSSGTQKGSTPVTLGDADSGPFWIGRTGSAPLNRNAANSLAVAIVDDGVYFWNYPSGNLVYQLDQDSWGTGVTASPGQH